jgi:hypothetical protein
MIRNATLTIHQGGKVMPEAIKKKKSTVKVISTLPAVNQTSIQDEIAKKAYELYEKRGGQDGNDLQDWLEAERLVLSEAAANKVG